MIQIFTTGGTIDKVYFDANSEFAIGDSLLPELLHEANVTSAFRIDELVRKDSLEMTDEDRAVIRGAVMACPAERILITHGTDTMAETARALADVGGKTIALQLLAPGVYIAMNGEVFSPERVRKNLRAQRFEAG